MDIRWDDGSLIIDTKCEGERRVLQSVIESLAGLKTTDFNYRSPSGPTDYVEPIDDQSIRSSIDKTLEVIS